MADRNALIECFRDTQRMIQENPALHESALRAQARTVLYLSGYEAIQPAEKSKGLTIEVLEDSSFHCTSRLVNGTDRVAVLNFANAYSPGGGVIHGAAAQEECLCRSSTLYCALTIPYLIRNYYKSNSKTTGDMGTDAVIYTPDVRVFKSDDELPVSLDEPFDVDVITCAAPYINPDRRKPVPEDKLRTVLEYRIRNILEVAANGTDALVLGAFGCGAFNNPPELVAEVFRSMLVDREYRRFFHRVVFAIKGSRTNDVNYQVFSKAFSHEA